jgi:beta-glucosidase
MSFTQFSLGEGKVSKNGDNFTLSVPVSNVGKHDGTEVVQVYLRDLSDPDGPLKSLRAFQRVDVKAGQTATARFVLTPKTFELFDPKTNTVHPHAGRYELLYGNSSRPEDLKRFEVTLQ